MYRAVTFPFLRWNGVKSSRRRAGRGPRGPPPPLPPPHPSFLFLSCPADAEHFQDRQTAANHLGAASLLQTEWIPVRLWQPHVEAGDRPWNVLPPVTQTDNVMWKELKANKKNYIQHCIRAQLFPWVWCVQMRARVRVRVCTFHEPLNGIGLTSSLTVKHHVDSVCAKSFTAEYLWCNWHLETFCHDK